MPSLLAGSKLFVCFAVPNFSLKLSQNRTLPVCEVIVSKLKTIFNWVSIVTPGLLRFCFTSLYNLLRKLAPFSQPIRFKTKTNRDLVIRVFPRSRQVTLFLPSVLIGSFWYFPLLWLAVVIILCSIFTTPNWITL